MILKCSLDKRREENLLYETRLAKHRCSPTKLWKEHYKDLEPQENGELAQLKASIVTQDKWV